MGNLADRVVVQFVTICSMSLISLALPGPWRASHDLAYAIQEETGEQLSPEESLNSHENWNDIASKFINLSYFGIFYGPSVGNPTKYQPDLWGQPDSNRPLLLKNFITLSHSFNQQFSLAGTGYWDLQPTQTLGFLTGDPFLRASCNSLVHWGGFNLYGDVRTHFPLSVASRQAHEILGLQTFQALTYEMGRSRILLGLYLSERANFFGANGYGNDLEFYVAPNISYQLAPNVGLTLLYESFTSHTIGQRMNVFNNEGTDLEPGVIWDITPKIMVNPYLNLMTGGKISLSSTSVGMMLSFIVL